MSDVSKEESLIENQDLLDILGAGSESTSELEKAMESDSTEDDIEATKKLDELKALAVELESTTKGSNPGSGDLDTDINNWFNGSDNLPSDGLNSYVGNASIKMDYGLTRHTLSSFEMMGSLRKFLDSSFEMLFDENVVMGLSPEDLENRVKLAFTMYKELGAQAQKTVMNIKDYKLKANSDSSDEVDKLSMLLSSIPSDKLKALLKEISVS